MQQTAVSGPAQPTRVAIGGISNVRTIKLSSSSEPVISRGRIMPVPLRPRSGSPASPISPTTCSAMPSDADRPVDLMPAAQA